jgi:hypothetical protein
MLFLSPSLSSPRHPIRDEKFESKYAAFEVRNVELRRDCVEAERRSSIGVGGERRRDVRMWETLLRRKIEER